MKVPPPSILPVGRYNIEFLVGPINWLFRLVYRRVPARVPRRKRPRLVWFPKYRAPVRLPQSVLEASEPFRQLEARVRRMGFALDSWTPGEVRFLRGKSWGDFSIKLMRIRVSLPTPLAPESEARVEVADVCLFDTGDLWKLTGEIVLQLERESPTAVDED